MSDLLGGLGLEPEAGETATPAATPETPETPAPAAPEPEVDEEIVVPEGAENPDAVKNLIAAERSAARAAYKRAREAEAKLAEIEEAGKPIEERLTSAQRIAADAKLEATRLRVGMKHGLPLTFAEMLKGEDEATLETNAQAIITELKNRGPAPTLPGLDGGMKTPPAAPANPAQAHNGFLVDVIRRHRTGA